MPQTTLVKYETDAGTIIRIRIGVGAQTVVGNTPPAGAVDDNRLFAYASNPGSARGEQLNARGLILERFLGTGLARKRLTTFVPILTRTALDTFTAEQAITINTVAYTVSRIVNEA